MQRLPFQRPTRDFGDGDLRTVKAVARRNIEECRAHLRTSMVLIKESRAALERSSRLLHWSEVAVRRSSELRHGRSGWSVWRGGLARRSGALHLVGVWQVGTDENDSYLPAVSPRTLAGADRSSKLGYAFQSALRSPPVSGGLLSFR